MAENENNTLFRKKTIDRISSPEDLNDYLKVTNPGIWIVLVAVVILLAGLFVWTCVGTLETSASATVVVYDYTAIVVMKDSAQIEEGMILSVSTQRVTIARVELDEYGRTIGKTEVMLPDGTYDGTVVIDQTRPIDFLISER